MAEMPEATNTVRAGAYTHVDMTITKAQHMGDVLGMLFETGKLTNKLRGHSNIEIGQFFTAIKPGCDKAIGE